MAAAPRRPPTRSRTVRLGRGHWGAVVALLLVAGLGAVSLGMGGYRRSDVRMSAGTAWLASPQGVVALLDGPSEQVIGTLRPSSAATAAPGVVQMGTSALVVDARAGTVSRIDGATYAVTGPAPLGGGSGSLQALPSRSRTFVVDGGRGRATIVDSDSLTPSDDVPLNAFPGAGQAVVDGNGDLWVVDGQGGGLTRLDPAGTLSPAQRVGDPASRLVVAAGRPVLVDVSGGRIGVVDDAGDVPSWACTDQQLGGDPQLLGGAHPDRVFAAVPDSGRLVVADLASGRCTSTTVAAAGTPLGPPVQDGRFVLVPDRATGQVVVVDPSRRTVVARADAVGPGTGFELIAKDGIVFYNDPGGPAAGVLREEGGQWAAGPQVQKYSTGAVSVPSLAAADSSLDPAVVPQGLPPPPGQPPAQSSRNTTAGAPATTTRAPGSVPPAASSAPSTWSSSAAPWTPPAPQPTPAPWTPPTPEPTTPPWTPPTPEPTTPPWTPPTSDTTVPDTTVPNPPPIDTWTPSPTASTDTTAVVPP
jgi:sugar lactone lactonase YvrE